MTGSQEKANWKKVAAVIIVIALLAALILVLLCVNRKTEDETPVLPAATEEPSIKPVVQEEPIKEEPTNAPAKEKRILLIETSDIHGYLMDNSSGNEETFQYRLAYIAQTVKEARESSAYDDVILVDGGDIYQGNPVSNLLNGAPILAAMDYMRYDAVCLGNHEFDWDVTAYSADKNGTLPAYRFGSYSGDPDIPVLASNLYDAFSGMRVPFTKDYVIVEKAGVRIALIGYLPDYSGSILSEKIQPYKIDSNQSRFSDKVKEINRTEKPDVTVVIAHSEPKTVAGALDPADVQLVAGGHKHARIFGVSSSGVPYIQSDCYAKGYASALIRVLTDGTVRVEELGFTDITADRKALYDTPENADKLDNTVLAISREAWAAVGDQMSEVLGYITTPVSKNQATGDNGSTTAGNWITGLMLRVTREQGTVAAFYNSGGIRTNLNCAKGTKREVTVGDIYTITPFGNGLYVYELTGEELKQQLVNGFRSSNYGDQMSGLTFTYTEEKTEKGVQITIRSITLDDGTEVDLNGRIPLYRVCVSSYNATLTGSVFEKKTPLVSETEAPVDNLAFIELLRSEASDNAGYLFVDTSPRGYRLVDAAEANDAA